MKPYVKPKKKQPTLKSMPYLDKFRMHRIGGQALATERYLWGIGHLERYRQRFQLTDSAEYMLAQLYDHEAKRRKERTLTFLAKAEQLYRNIAHRNPKYFLARYGIGRIYWIRGDYQNALRWQQRAYREMITQPGKLRGALGIGQLYEEKGNYANAERWYRKEFRDMAGDFGTTMNLMRFYKRRGDHQKARGYAMRAARILETEFNRAVYRGLRIHKSKYLRRIRRHIDEAKAFLP